MIDPRFSNTGAAPFAPGYGAQQVPAHHHHHHHHRHRKTKHGNIGGSPISRDESIHKVDHGQNLHYQQNGVQAGSGYGVPYGVGGFGAGNTGGYYQQQQQQQQQFTGGNFGYGNQSQGNTYTQGQFGGNPFGSIGKRHRRHHRHHRHNAASVTDQAQAVPEQLIGQRSSSVLGSEGKQVRSPSAQAQDENRGENVAHHRHHRHRHHHGGEQQGFRSAHQSRRTNAQQSHKSTGADGYGHINEELIFIERGEHSPHRQEPPTGYEYKGKIEVQNVDREIRSRSRGSGHFVGPQPVPIPQPVAPVPSAGPCPPGWQQVIMAAAGGAMYTGQVVGGGGGGFIGNTGLGGIGGFSGGTGGADFSGVGPVGVGGSVGGLANLAASFPIPPQGQIIEDYIVESNAGGISSSGGSTSGVGYQLSGGGAISVDPFHSHGHSEETEERVSSRTKIIEVWQKRAKSEPRERSRSRSRSRHRSHEHSPTPTHGPTFNFELFRNEILDAIKRIVQTNENSNIKIKWPGHDGGTQTQIGPSPGGRHERPDIERQPSTSGGGEVRVIVQPIQPVFYMPRQPEGPTPAQQPFAPGPAIQQPTSEAPKIVYIPRNVYVPVIKPVFVPRERVIVRPQIIHVARPVLVDRPVPVTQRPIIIDRERPIPVPVRGSAQGAAQGGGSRIVQEEYVYRDNVPVAYGGRCAEFTGGANYGYIPTQEAQQYAGSSAHEESAGYQTQGPVINVSVPNQFQQSRSASQLNVPHGGSSFHGSYSNLPRTNSASAMHASSSASAGRIEVLDSTINANWQKIDQSSLVHRYGRPAFDIVQKTNQVEQEMYQELRRRSSSGGVQRSGSAGSFASDCGGGIGPSGGSFSSIPSESLNHFNTEGIHHQGQAHLPVRNNY